LWYILEILRHSLIVGGKCLFSFLLGISAFIWHSVIVSVHLLASAICIIIDQWYNKHIDIIINFWHRSGSKITIIFSSYMECVMCMWLYAELLDDTQTNITCHQKESICWYIIQGHRGLSVWQISIQVHYFISYAHNINAFGVVIYSFWPCVVTLRHLLNVKRFKLQS